MKVKVSTLLASFAAVFLLTFSAKAQEELPVLEIQDPNHRELNLDEDKTLIYDHPSHTSVTRDSISAPSRMLTNPVPKAAKPETHKSGRKGGEEEDTLSYNFLYYMFQKFKMSDLIDQN